MIFLRKLVLACVILLSGGNLLIPRIPLAVVTLLLIIAYLSHHIFDGRQDRFKIYTWTLLVVSLSFVRLDHVDIIANATRILNFIIGILIIYIYSDDNLTDKFSSDYQSLCMPLAYVSIITFILGSMLPSVFSLVVGERQEMYSLLLIFNYSSISTEYTGAVRTIGFFWEPGVFQIYLNVLLFVLFLKKQSVINITLAVAAIFATQSTTGIVIACMQIGYFSLISVRRQGGVLAKLAIPVAAAVSAPFIYDIVLQNLNEKLLGVLAGSTTARQFDFELAMYIIKNNPIFGIGFSPIAFIEQAATSGLDTSRLSMDDQNIRANTNGAMMVLYTTGLPLGMYFLSSLFFQKIFTERVLFGFLLLTALITSPLAFTPFFLMFAFSGMSKTNALQANDSIQGEGRQ